MIFGISRDTQAARVGNPRETMERLGHRTPQGVSCHAHHVVPMTFSRRREVPWSDSRVALHMADTEKTPAMLPYELAALDPPQRHEVAAGLRSVAETFAGVPDGRDTAHALRALAHMLDPS